MDSDRDLWIRKRSRTGVISLPRLHDQAFGLYRDADSPEAARIRFFGREAQAVLTSQLFLDAVVDLIDGQFFRDFEKTSARLLRDLFEDTLALRSLALLRLGKSSATPASTAKASAAERLPLTLLSGEQDRINQRIGS
jgi:hypothetical protein